MEKLGVIMSTHNGSKKVKNIEKKIRCLVPDNFQVVYADIKNDNYLCSQCSYVLAIFLFLLVLVLF